MLLHGVLLINLLTLARPYGDTRYYIISNMISCFYAKNLLKFTDITVYVLSVHLGNA